jgi:hypothetical protein
MTRALGDAGLGFDLDDAGQFLSPLWELIKAKAAALLAFIAGLFAALAKKVDEFFPPESRPETLGQWLRVRLTVVLPALVLLCLARCCWRCCCARGRGRRMMAAPGRRGARMPRGVFEANTRSYFLDLRANKPLVFVH